MLLSILIFLSCVFGIAISLYFCGIYYEWFNSDVAWIPRFCRLEGQDCTSIVKTDPGKFFGLPNALWGMVFYTFIIFQLFVFPPVLGIAFAVLVVLRSVYLIYALLFKIRVHCVLCFMAHGINLAVFLLLLLRAWEMGF